MWSPPARAPRLVALDAPADARWIEAVQRIWAQGDAVAPLPPDILAARRTVAVLRPDAVADAHGEVRAAPPAPPPAAALPPLPDDAALVVATSGSSGAPRAVVLGHGALAAATAAGRRALGLDGEVWLSCLPLHHVAGVLVRLRAAAAGRPPVALERFDARAVADVLADRSTTVAAVSLVPTMLGRLLDAGAELSRLQTVLLGGARLDPRLAARADAAGVPVVTSYGMSETAGGVVYDGLPIAGVGAAVDERGRILLSGPTLLSGYRDGTSPALRGGWLVTPDVGDWDDEGRLRVDGRADDVIVSGAEKVSAATVAAALRALPAVVDAAVVGVGDAEWGERVEAWVTLADPGGDVASCLSAVAEQIRPALPPAARPKRISAVPAIPRTALAKVARPALEATPVLGVWPDPPPRPAVPPPAQGRVAVPGWAAPTDRPEPR